METKRREQGYLGFQRDERDDEIRVKETEDLVVERVMRIGTHMSCNGHTVIPFFLTKSLLFVIE